MFARTCGRRSTGPSRSWGIDRTSRPGPWPVRAPTSSGCWRLGLRCSVRLAGSSHSSTPRAGTGTRWRSRRCRTSRPRSVAEGIKGLLARGVEGLVIEVPTHLVEVDALQLGGLPVVTSAGRIAGIDNQTVIDVDQAGVCRELTEHLLDLGHETVWHIAGPDDWDASEKRQAGWRSALEAAGRRVPPVLVGDWSARSGYELGRQLASSDRGHGGLRGERPHGDGRAPGLRRGRAARFRPTCRWPASTTSRSRSSRWCR